MELFFDLTMVFALNRLVASAVTALAGPGLGTADLARRWTAIGQALLLFAPVTWTWILTAYTTARFDPRSPRTQWALLGTAAAMLIMGTAVPDAFGATGLTFGLTYAFIQITRTLYFGYFIRRHPMARMLLRSLLWSVPVGLLWIAGGLVSGAARVALWLLAVTLSVGTARLGWPVPGLGRGQESAWALAPHHLAERAQQLVLVALGETILAVGIVYAGGTGRPSAAQTAGLAAAFVTAVLLWRIYFHRAGQVMGEAVADAREPAALGRFVGTAHTVMIFGIVMTAIGHELIQVGPSGRPYPAWLVMILGGPACFLIGRAALERAVFDRVSPSRWVGAAVLVVAGVPLLAGSPLVAGITAAVVLLGIALLNTRRAAHRPLEEPRPGSVKGIQWWRRP
ncbi:low temperature requirement protein A [Micromonospora sp. HK10]|uniref:low temperature requirement protein A n=1 Tax=Micromonospora sp. HK10 TaxID=1538294 RepID=UPI000696B902|nr:low temperature requirement protein A [Micromonospora sp. HK10]